MLKVEDDNLKSKKSEKELETTKEDKLLCKQKI